MAQHALRPVLARAYLGFDKDCRELIDHLTTKWHQPVRVDGGWFFQSRAPVARRQPGVVHNTTG